MSDEQTRVPDELKNNVEVTAGYKINASGSDEQRA